MHSLDYLRVQVHAFPRVTYIMIHLAIMYANEQDITWGHAGCERVD